MFFVDDDDFNARSMRLIHFYIDYMIVFDTIINISPIDMSMLMFHFL